MDWYLKANEIIDALNKLDGSDIPHVQPKDYGIYHADELTNAIIDKVNLFND